MPVWLHDHLCDYLGGCMFLALALFTGFPVALVLGSILAGWAAPTDAAGVGAFGATLLAWANGRLSLATLDWVCMRTALTVGMILLIFAGATAFACVFRALHGEDLIHDFIRWMGLGPWGCRCW